MRCNLQFICILWTKKKPYTISNSYFHKKKLPSGSLLCIYYSLNFVNAILLLIYRRIPPPFLFPSRLNGVHKPCIETWETGMESSSFVSVIIKISISSETIFLSKSNLFLMEFMFKWPIMMFLGRFKRRYLRRNSGGFLTIPKLSKETDVSREAALLKHFNFL